MTTTTNKQITREAGDGSSALAAGLRPASASRLSDAKEETMTVTDRMREATARHHEKAAFYLALYGKKKDAASAKRAAALCRSKVEAK